jgi:transposase InsO family protein
VETERQPPRHSSTLLTMKSVPHRQGMGGVRPGLEIGRVHDDRIELILRVFVIEQHPLASPATAVQDEFLERVEFESVPDARAKAHWFRREYNTIRPHSSIDYKTPREFSEECDKKSRVNDSSKSEIEHTGNC